VGHFHFPSHRKDIPSHRKHINMLAWILSFLTRANLNSLIPPRPTVSRGLGKLQCYVNWEHFSEKVTFLILWDILKPTMGRILSIAASTIWVAKQMSF
jgi:hypothetical protein